MILTSSSLNILPGFVFYQPICSACYLLWHLLCLWFIHGDSIHFHSCKLFYYVTYTVYGIWSPAFHHFM
jgi:hypothetical protein